MRIRQEEKKLPQMQAEWDKTTDALNSAVAEYGKWKAKAAGYDRDELDRARQLIRANKENEARKKIQEEYGFCNHRDFNDSAVYIDKRIGEYVEPKEKAEETNEPETVHPTPIPSWMRSGKEREERER